MLPKYKVYGDPNNKPSFSSSIIINALNEGAQKMGLFDENGLTVVYDCVCNDHGYNADALIGCYEIPWPEFVVQNAKGRPVIGVSADNMFFSADGGHPLEKISFIPLGVDCSAWKPVTRSKKNADKFVLLCYTESLVRGGIDMVLDALAELDEKQKNEILFYVKDRNATDKFKAYIERYCEVHGINLYYTNRHISNIDEEREVYSECDAFISLNRSSTFSMPPLQAMACGIPVICHAYSGPRSYILNEFTGLSPDYKLFRVNSQIQSLEQKGMRNFFFPCRDTDYWSGCDERSVRDCILKLKNNVNLRNRLSRYGRKMAESMSWENASLQLGYRLFEFKQKGLIK